MARGDLDRNPGPGLRWAASRSPTRPGSCSGVSPGPPALLTARIWSLSRSCHCLWGDGRPRAPAPRPVAPPGWPGQSWTSGVTPQLSPGRLGRARAPHGLSVPPVMCARWGGSERYCWKREVAAGVGLRDGCGQGWARPRGPEPTSPDPRPRNPWRNPGVGTGEVRAFLPPFCGDTPSPGRVWAQPRPLLRLGRLRPSESKAVPQLTQREWAAGRGAASMAVPSPLLGQPPTACPARWGPASESGNSRPGPGPGGLRGPT